MEVLRQLAHQLAGQDSIERGPVDPQNQPAGANQNDEEVRKSHHHHQAAANEEDPKINNNNNHQDNAHPSPVVSFEAAAESSSSSPESAKDGGSEQEQQQQQQDLEEPNDDDEEVNSQSSDDTLSMGGEEEEEDNDDDSSSPREQKKPKQQVPVKSLHDLAFYSSEEDEEENVDNNELQQDEDSSLSANDDYGDNEILQEDEDSSLSADEYDDDDDDDESVYELPKACMETNEVGVGSLVCVSWKRKTGKGKRKTTETFQLWGEIVGKRSEELFDVKCEKNKLLKNVSIDDMLTLESPQMKNEKLSKGDIVYAAWPGKDPKTELCFWGKVQNVHHCRTAREGVQKRYSIIFFPTEDSHGLVDITPNLESEYIYREKEALYLMRNGDVLGVSELPTSSRMTLDQLVQQRNEQAASASEKEEDEKEKEKEPKKRKQKARTSAAKTKKAAAAAAAVASNNNKPKKRRKVVAASTISKKEAATEEEQSSDDNNDCLQDPSTYELNKGDLVYAPYPNVHPEIEGWYWGSVKGRARRKFNTMVVDVGFPDNLQSVAVKRENLYKLESQDYKDSVIQENDKVYGPWPGKKPQMEAYYWGRVVGIHPNKKRNNNNKKKNNVYTIRYADGDVTKNLESTHFHRYAECIHMMKHGWLDKDDPPANL